MAGMAVDDAIAGLLIRAQNDEQPNIQGLNFTVAFESDYRKSYTRKLEFKL